MGQTVQPLRDNVLRFCGNERVHKPEQWHCVAGTPLAWARIMRQAIFAPFLGLLLGCNAGIINARAHDDTDAVRSRLEHEFIVASCPDPATFGITCGLVSTYTNTPEFWIKFKASQCNELEDDACAALLAQRQIDWERQRYFAAAWNDIVCDRHEPSCERRLLRAHDIRLNASAASEYQTIADRRQSEHDADNNAVALRLLRGFSAFASTRAFVR
jgi:hypothetical protein